MFKKMLLVLISFVLLFSCFTTLVVADDEKPDLIIDDLNAPSIIFEGESMELFVQIKNQGDKNISEGQTITVGLFLDYSVYPVASNITTEGLSKNEISYVNISWVPSFGDEKQHYLSVVVNYDYALDEGIIIIMYGIFL